MLEIFIGRREVEIGADQPLTIDTDESAIKLLGDPLGIDVVTDFSQGLPAFDPCRNRFTLDLHELRHVGFELGRGIEGSAP